MSFAWSVRRELWENRSLYVAPLAVAAVVLLGYSIRVLTLPQKYRALAALDPGQQRAGVVMPFSMAATLIMFTAFLAGIFYCLDALHGERRDRSILFWKSLPVSDLTTVLSKAAIPLAVLPVLAAALVPATQLVMVLMAAARLSASGAGAALLWRELPLVQMAVIQVYGLAVHALWFAPLYAWLLLVSAWARRTPFLWAALPPLAICVLERMALGTSHIAALIGRRVSGAMVLAFGVDARDGGLITELAQLTPLRFLASPGLWVGLAVAGGFLLAAARLRRRRGPI